MDRPEATSEQNGAGHRTTGDPLSLSAEAMREIGYRTIDLVVDQLTNPAIPAMRRGHPLELCVRIAHDAPDGPRGMGRAAERARGGARPRCASP